VLIVKITWEMSAKTTPDSATATVLVVEDEPGVQKIVTAMLEGLGYRVLVANDGPEALEILDETEGIDILLSDVVMPQGMNGFDLADTAVARHQHLKVLMTSGYPDAELRRSGNAASSYHLIAKPYSMTDIIEALNAVQGTDQGG
jgi:two-component system CheB/CheR fusion protein